MIAAALEVSSGYLKLELTPTKKPRCKPKNLTLHLRSPAAAGGHAVPVVWHMLKKIAFLARSPLCDKHRTPNNSALAVPVIVIRATEVSSSKTTFLL